MSRLSLPDGTLAVKEETHAPAQGSADQALAGRADGRVLSVSDGINDDTMQLVRLDEALRWLAESETVEQVKTVRDLAETMRGYALRVGLGLQAQNRAAEIKLRAERKAGELLADMPKHPAGRPPENPSIDTTDLPPTLAELDITRDQSSAWQRIATLPADDFEAYIADTKAAHQELTSIGAVRLAKAQRPPLVEKPSVNHRGELGMVLAKPAAAETTFNRTNEHVDWAWWTWNPITGCAFGCPWCYARPIANRLYAQGFEPTFHADRLPAPVNTRLPDSDDPGARRVFLCSQSDMFGPWVPDDWRDEVLAAVRAAPEWTFLTLTKGYEQLEAIDWPPNVWVGVSVPWQHSVVRAERALAVLRARYPTMRLWMSCEPFEERLTFTTGLRDADLVAIGGRSATNQPWGHVPAFWPPFEWVADLYQQARAAGCPVWLKENAVSGDTPVPKELPRDRRAE